VPVLRAPAKLTLSLRVTGVRPDGYHLIDAEMVTLDLCDELDIHELDTDDVGTGDVGTGDVGTGDVDTGDVDTEGAGGDVVVERDGRRHPAPDDDLVRRALELAGRRAGVVLHKRIPAGAGLGGGSADAAAVLRWAGWDDPAAAVVLGADVPFCLVGGRARVRGIGEVLEPLAHQPMEVTLLTPPVHCATPQVYRRWDELGGPSGAGPNDLEAAALDLHPELDRWRRELAEVAGAQPSLAGSGSTWWVRGAFPGPGRVVARTIPAWQG
jgi:4-diphosphocytidyl-2-C-methyl-D-erythritol kinase